MEKEDLSNISVIGAAGPLHNGSCHPELQPDIAGEDQGREIESKQLHSQFHSKKIEF